MNQCNALQAGAGSASLASTKTVQHSTQNQINDTKQSQTKQQTNHSQTLHKLVPQNTTCQGTLTKCRIILHQTCFFEEKRIFCATLCNIHFVGLKSLLLRAW
jgi:hypothetical protein